MSPLDALSLGGYAPLAGLVAGWHGLTVGDLVGRNRTPHVARARHEFWALLHGTYGLSKSEIARVCGVDPSTVIVTLARREARR